MRLRSTEGRRSWARRLAQPPMPAPAQGGGWAPQARGTGHPPAPPPGAVPCHRIRLPHPEKASATRAEPPPPASLAICGRWSQAGKRAVCLRGRRVSDEPDCRSVPTAANLKAQHDKLAPLRSGLCKAGRVSAHEAQRLPESCSSCLDQNAVETQAHGNSVCSIYKSAVCRHVEGRFGRAIWLAYTVCLGCRIRAIYSHSGHDIPFL